MSMNRSSSYRLIFEGSSYPVCSSATAMCMCATVIIQGLAFKGSILCVQQCNSHVCNCDHTKPLALNELWCVQQCNSHVCNVNCDHPRPSLWKSYVCNSATAMCTTVIIQGLLPSSWRKYSVCNSHVCNCDHARHSLWRKYGECNSTNSHACAFIQDLSK